MAKYDFGSAASGAISGAATGSIFGPIGTGVGALAGGALGLFGSKKKKKKKDKQVSTLDPQQQALYNDYVKGIRGEGPLAGNFNFDAEGYNNVFDQTVGRPAYRNFQENIIPQITGQFRQNNIGNSSYTGEALSRAGRNVQENLDAQRSANIFQGQQTANQNRINGIGNVLNMNTFDYQQRQQKPNSIDQLLNSVAPAAGEWISSYLKDQSNKTAPAAPTTPAIA